MEKTQRTHELVEIGEILRVLTVMARQEGAMRKNINAVVLVPSLGQKESIRQGIRVARNRDADVLVYGGNNDEELCANGETTLNETKNFFQHVVVHQRAQNTKDQAQQVIRTLEEHAVRSALLTAPAWHSMRVYLTYVAELMRQQLRIRLYPYPVAGERTLEPQSAEHQKSGYGTVRDAIKSELARCLEYQQTGDVATLKQLNEYLARTELLI